MQTEFASSSILVRDGWLMAFIPTGVDTTRFADKAGVVRITVGQVRSTGERSQNRHLNGHVQQLAQETGDEFQSVKWDIKMRAIKRGYPTRTTKDGHVIPWSESESDTKECAMLIDTAHEVAAFLGITLQETNQGEVQ